jgi:excisionase family DNA binding protein
MTRPEHEARTVALSPSRYLSTAVIARRLAVTPRTIRLWAECGQVPAFKVGRKWRFERLSFEKWLGSQVLNSAFSARVPAEAGSDVEINSP